ncbi:MAG TPA: cytosine permease [Actinomycetota bacterium]|jgi:putative hydroxymethylpyrimidine transporter CytX
MATVTERLERALEREAPSWGIRPVPPEHRRLSGLDFAVLWGDLSLGLLVLLTGALLVPALGFPRALLVIVVGSLIGCVPLALVGLAGSREGVPGMVLFRPVLGVRGSYVPSVLNIVQLIGWTGFEFWAMSLVANRMLHVSYWFWLAVAGVVCTALALGGPILVVRKWLERFGAWVVAGVAAWITIRVLTTANLGLIWHRPGQGGMPFWLAVDLVIAMPVSWLPLVADYNRFARRGVRSAAGTYWGYAAGNIWFYALGALLVLGAGLTDPSPAGLGQAIAALAGGWVVLLALLVGETDEAFADIYSSAVSSQNLEARISQRGAIVAVSLAGAGLATWLGLRPNVAVGTYESFLFLLGSVFVPLFGVFVADYFLLGRRGRLTAEMLDRELRGDGVRRQPRVNIVAILSWVVGFLMYQWSWTVPPGLEGWQTAMSTLFDRWLHLPYPLAGSRWGASIPAFLAALAIHSALSWTISPSRTRQQAAGPSSRR